MGTIIINGKRYTGNDVAIRGGKVVIDGKVQAGKLRGGVKLKVTDRAVSRAQSVVSVASGEAQGGAIHAVAVASADDDRRSKNTNAKNKKK